MARVTNFGLENAPPIHSASSKVKKDDNEEQLVDCDCETVNRLLSLVSPVRCPISSNWYGYSGSLLHYCFSGQSSLTRIYHPRKLDCLLCWTIQNPRQQHVPSVDSVFALCFRTGCSVLSIVLSLFSAQQPWNSNPRVCHSGW